MKCHDDKAKLKLHFKHHADRQKTDRQKTDRKNNKELNQQMQLSSAMKIVLLIDVGQHLNDMEFNFSSLDYIFSKNDPL